MRQLLPPPELSPPDRPSDPAAGGASVDPYEAYRPVRARWLRINMVVSLDGAVTDSRGRSGGLGGTGDRLVFRTLRALADGIVVGAGTVRTEGYGPHRPTRELGARRAGDGRPPCAPIVVVTGSGALDYGSALFTEAVAPTVVLTCASAPAERRRAAAAAGRVVVAGEESVDLAQGLHILREELGMESLLCEGGPALNAGLLRADLVDELCTTLAPQLAPGPSPRLVGDLGCGRALTLTGVLEHDGELFLRHGIPRHGPARGRAGVGADVGPQTG